MEDRSDGGIADEEQIPRLRARAEAGDRDAAGLLGELLAREGDLEGALRVWADAYGDTSQTTRRIAELLAEDGDLEGAVHAWRFSDVVWQNRIGLHAQYLATLTDEERLDEDDPEDRGFMEYQHLTRLLAERGDQAAIERMRKWLNPGGSAAPE